MKRISECGIRGLYEKAGRDYTEAVELAKSYQDCHCDDLKVIIASAVRKGRDDIGRDWKDIYEEIKAQLNERV